MIHLHVDEEGSAGASEIIDFLSFCTRVDNRAAGDTDWPSLKDLTDIVMDNRDMKVMSVIHHGEFGPIRTADIASDHPWYEYELFSLSEYDNEITVWADDVVVWRTKGGRCWED